MNEVTEGTSVALDRLDEIGLALEAGFRSRLQHLGAIGSEWDTLLQGLAAGGVSLSTYIAIILATYLGSLVAFYAIRHPLQRLAARSGRFSPFIEIAAAILALILMALVVRFVFADGTERQVARFWTFAALLGVLVHRLLTALLLGHSEGQETEPHLLSFARTLSFGFACSLVGLAALATLRVWHAGAGLRDFVATFLINIPVTAILVYAYWHHRKTVSAAVAGPGPWSLRRRRFADAWPGIAIAAMLGTFIALQAAATLGRPLPGLAMLGSLLLVLIAPHVDSLIKAWSVRKARDPATSLLSATLRRMARFAFTILVVGLLIYLWALPALTSVGFDVTLIRGKAVEIILVALVGGMIWSLTAAGIDRLEHKGNRHEVVASTSDDAHAPHTRLETLLPLLTGTAKAGILILSVLTILVILEVNVWPLITGLSVFGLAVGFGSQTLVKDIVSGLFFLLDDAFRMGEYIETSGAKGTVERISVRSVSLRHPRGAIATIPYGQIGKIQNYSRDWVIEKMVFRVAFDTDVDKVRKLFKQIGQEIAADPELSPDLLETFKSQGISSVEDGTLLIRGKFMARAGKQFGIRKAVLSAVQRAFRENGIKAVPKPISGPGSEVAGP